MTGKVSITSDLDTEITLLANGLGIQCHISYCDKTKKITRPALFRVKINRGKKPVGDKVRTLAHRTKRSRRKKLSGEIKSAHLGSVGEKTIATEPLG